MRRWLAVIFCGAIPVPAMSDQANAPHSGLRIEIPTIQLLPEANFVRSVTSRSPSPAPGAYGQGFDSISGKFLSKKCVKVISLHSRGGALPIGRGEHVFHEASSLEQVRNDSKIAASASLLYEGFSASAGGSVVNGSFSSSYGRYVTAYQEIITDEFEARGEGPNGDLALTQPALKDLALGPTTFRASCGDHFISGYKLGGVFNIVAVVKATVNKDWKQNEENVSVGFKGIFGADFSHSANYSKINDASSFDVRDLSLGVISPAVTLENLQKSYEGYQALVMAKPAIITLVFTPYNALGGQEAKKIPNLTALEEAKLEELARKRDRARTNSNDLEVANDAIGRGLTGLFTIDGKPEDARVELDAYFAEIAKAVDVCRHATIAAECIKAIDAVPSVPSSRVRRS